MDKKYGVYICTGCGIGEALDIAALSDVAEEEALPVQTHPFLCGPEGVDVIKKDIADKGINTMVICACSRRVNFDVFRFDGCIVERVNLREQVVWSHPRSEFPALEEDQKDSSEHFDRVQMLAEDYLKMGMARVEKVSLPAPHLMESLTRKIMVIGGGVTGMAAALDAAAAGYDVTIVEKEAALGGHATHWRSQLPTQMPYESLIAPQVEAMIAKVEAEPKIAVRTQTVVARIAGEPGDFTATLKKPGEKIPFDVPYPLPDEMKVDENGKEFDVETLAAKYKEYNEGRHDILRLDPDGEKFGAVVLAAGWRAWQPAGDELAHYGYGELADVISNEQFELIAKAGKIKRSSDGREAKSVVFIQSPGAGDDGDFAYTGGVTTLVSLKQAKYVREDYADGKAYVFYQHMRTPGHMEYF